MAGCGQSPNRQKPNGFVASPQVFILWVVDRLVVLVFWERVARESGTFFFVLKVLIHLQSSLEMCIFVVGKQLATKVDRIATRVLYFGLLA